MHNIIQYHDADSIVKNIFNIFRHPERNQQNTKNIGVMDSKGRTISIVAFSFDI